MYCDKEEKWENSCPILIKKAEREIETFWEMVMSLERTRSIEKEAVWREFYSKINTFLAFLLGNFYIKPLKRKYLYPKLDEIDKKYDEIKKKLDWERIRKLELWRENMFHKLSERIDNNLKEWFSKDSRQNG